MGCGDGSEAGALGPEGCAPMFILLEEASRGHCRG